ncbi:MAG: PaaI family thioesterase [Novosphingobium sp.]
MSVAELEEFFRQAFPDAEEYQHARIDRIEPGRLRLVLEPDAMALRPGGVVSGPTQMGLADRAAYAVILAHIGPVAMAVTSNLNFTFLRKVPHARLVADAQLLKLGRRLATVDVRLWQDDDAVVLGQATVTYAIPVA